MPRYARRRWIGRTTTSGIRSRDFRRRGRGDGGYGRDVTEPGEGKLPPGIRDCLTELFETHQRRRSADVLTVVPILSELALLLDGVATGRVPLFENDRTSLVCDLDLALTRAGAALNSATLHHLRTKEISRLASVFGDPASANQLAATVRKVLDQLRTEDAVGSSWDDMIAAIRDGAASASECACAWRNWLSF
jgi:hypothetical protein